MKRKKNQCVTTEIHSRGKIPKQFNMADANTYMLKWMTDWTITICCHFWMSKKPSRHEDNGKQIRRKTQLSYLSITLECIYVKIDASTSIFGSIQPIRQQFCLPHFQCRIEIDFSLFRTNKTQKHWILSKSTYYFITMILILKFIFIRRDCLQASNKPTSKHCSFHKEQ